MSDLKGYVNPRSLGNEEINQALGMDLFFEDALWQQHIAHKTQQNLRAWDVCWMLRSFCGSPQAIYESPDGKKFVVSLGRRNVSLRAYIHPNVMALCVGELKASGE